MPARPDIVVTGLGAVSALGLDTTALWRALDAGRHGIAPIVRYPTGELGVHVAAMVPWPEDVPPGWTLGELFAVRAAREAARDAALEAVPRGRIALVLGTMGELRGDVGQSADRLAAALDVRGPRITVSTACTSSANAIGLARDLVEAGWADVAIAGGTDELEKALLAGFAALGVLSETPCAPFSTPVGTSLGEGAAFVVLERAGRRPAIASLLGYGLSSDAHHETSPHPHGAGVARAIRAALDDAGLPPSAIEYVNAHGTGTEHNDVAEWRAVTEVFGASPPPVSASKSQLGHAQGAAGALELVATLLARREAALLPTLRFCGPRARGPADPVASDRPRAGRFDRALSTSSAFGGANAAIVVGSSVERTRARRPVFWLGHASVGLDDPMALRLHAPHVDPRGLDPSMRMLIAAAGAALKGGGAIRGAERDRAGVVLGATRISRASLFAYQGSIRARGFGHVDTSAFARVIPHAPAARCSMAFALRGPASTVHAGGASGLVALAHAAELIATRGDVDRMIAAGLDEAHVPETGASGAACASIAAAPHPKALRIAGWAVAGGLEEAIARASGAAVPRVAFGAASVEHSPAFTSMSFALDAARAVQNGAKRALAFAAGGGTSAAVVLTED